MHSYEYSHEMLFSECDFCVEFLVTRSWACMNYWFTKILLNLQKRAIHILNDQVYLLFKWPFQAK